MDHTPLVYIFIFITGELFIKCRKVTSHWNFEKNGKNCFWGLWYNNWINLMPKTKLYWNTIFFSNISNYWFNWLELVDLQSWQTYLKKKWRVPPFCSQRFILYMYYVYLHQAEDNLIAIPLFILHLLFECEALAYWRHLVLKMFSRHLEIF